MPTAFPEHGRAGNRNSGWSDDQAGQSFLHIRLQRHVERKLGLRRAILQAAAPGGSVAPQLPRDRRRCPPKPASDFLYGVTLRPKERDLLSLRKRIKSFCIA